MNLIDVCKQNGVGKFVFSSSAAVYGNPEAVPVSEEMATVPINPYGRTKLITEWNLRDIALASQNSSEQIFSYVALRYFNVAGARFDGTLGQATPEATHLIKVACEAALGKRTAVTLFGTDYDTPDGTCIRDYIHVVDLAEGHVSALEKAAPGYAVYNLGTGRPVSVLELIASFEKAVGRALPTQILDRRPGDVSQRLPRLLTISREFTASDGGRPKRDRLAVRRDSVRPFDSEPT